MAYVRTVRTSSGATAVQIVYSSRRGSREIEHLGSAHTGEQVEALKAVALQRIAGGQQQLDLGLEVAAVAAAGGPLEITGSRMGHLWDGLSRAYDALGFDDAAGGDEVFRALVLARIIEPTSKEDSIRVIEETAASRGRIARSSGGCRSTRRRRGVAGCRRRAPSAPLWGRRALCSTT